MNYNAKNSNLATDYWFQFCSLRTWLYHNVKIQDQIHGLLEKNWRSLFHVRYDWEVSIFFISFNFYFYYISYNVKNIFFDNKDIWIKRFIKRFIIRRRWIHMSFISHMSRVIELE